MQLLEWNEKNNIRFMRLSSEMCPFASHAEYGYDLSFADAELKALGEFANKHGHRLTTHPGAPPGSRLRWRRLTGPAGQFTQLGSPRKEVVDNAIRDLKYHSEMLDRIGCGKDSVMIIHGAASLPRAASLIKDRRRRLRGQAGGAAADSRELS